MSSRRWLVGLALVLLTIAAFADLRRADFVQLDDPVYVSENPRLRDGLTASSVRWALTTFDNANWHPVTWVSHLVDVELFGLDARGHHLMNLALHAANVLLLFAVLVSLTSSTWRSAFVAALFAVHPLHVESVAWISERKDVLSTSCWLLTMWAYVRYVRVPGWRRYAVVVIPFAVGLMAKPMLVTLPFVLLLLDSWPLRRNSTVRHLVIEKLPLLALAAASSVITVLAQQRGGAVMSLESVPFDVRLQNAVVSYVVYLRKLIWPVDLTMFYPFRPAPMSTVVLAAVVLGAITIAVVAVRRRNSAPAVGWFWYLGTMVPVIGLVQVGRQAMADRYTYVPFIGIFIGLAWAVPSLARKPAFVRAVTAIAAVAIVLASAAATRAQVAHWQSNAALWERAIAVTLEVDTARARLATAGLITDSRHIAETVGRFFQTDRAKALDELGQLLVARGHLDEAAVTFNEAIALAPATAAAHEHLGRALAMKGQAPSAVAAFTEATRLDPTLQPAHANLGRLLGQLGQFDRAAQHLNEAVRLNPRDAAARCDLGLALSNLGRFDEALAQYDAALQIDPAMPELHNNLGLVRATQDRLAEAVTHFQEAVRLNPSYVEALRNLGVAHLKLGRPNDAADAFRAVLRLAPSDETARRALDLIGR